MTDMTQAKFAASIGCHQSAISKMETGRLPIPEGRLPELAGEIPEGLRAAILRRRMGLTVGAVAARLSVHAHRIGEMERGSRAVSGEYWKLLNVPT
jgi:transcriptional regulator with XRE-family HTH domain